MVYEQRSYPGAAPDTTLNADITAGALTFSVATGTGSGYPDGSGGPFFIIVDYDNSKAEKIRCTARSGDTFTVPASNGRGVDGTTAQAHSNQAKVRAVWTATDAAEANLAVVNTVGRVTAKGDLLVGSSAGTLARLPVGTTGQVPTAQADGSVAYAAIPTSPDATKIPLSTVTTKGDLIVATGNAAVARLPVGTTGQVPTVQPDGSLAYNTPATASSRGPLIQTGAMAPLYGTTSATLTANKTYYMKFRCQETVTITALWFAPSASATGTVYAGVYADSAGAPGSKLASGSKAISTLAPQSLTIASTTLTAGTDYWLALSIDNTTASLLTQQQASNFPAANYFKVDTATANMPATASPTNGGSNIPLVWYENG